MSNTFNNPIYQLHCPTPEALKTAIEYLYSLGYKYHNETLEGALKGYQRYNWLTLKDHSIFGDNEESHAYQTIDFDFLFNKLGKEEESSNKKLSISDNFRVFVPDDAKEAVVKYLYNMGYSNGGVTLEDALSIREVMDPLWINLFIELKTGSFWGRSRIVFDRNTPEVSLNYIFTKLPRFESKPKEIEVVLNGEGCRVIVGKEKVRVESPEIFEFPVSIIDELIKARDDVKDVQEIISPDIKYLELYCPDGETKKIILEFVIDKLGYKSFFVENPSIDAIIDRLSQYNYLVLFLKDKTIGGNRKRYSGNDPRYMLIDFNFIFTKLARIADAEKTVKLNDNYTAQITKQNIKVNCQVFALGVLDKLEEAVKQVKNA